VRSLGRFGTAEMIPLLQNVANSDPQSRRLDNGEMFSDVRDTAAKAIQSIRSREQPNVH